MPTIRIPVKWHAEISAKELREYLLAHQRMRPVVFIIPVKYSAWLEFGTGPAQRSSDGELYMAIYTWLRRKKGITNQKELERLAKQISGRIARYGLRARPFWRPAFYATADNLQQLFDRGYSLMDIVQWMATKVNDNIMWNVNAPAGSEYMPDTGALQMGWIIRYLDEDESDDAKDTPLDVNEIADKVWSKNSNQRRS